MSVENFAFLFGLEKIGKKGYENSHHAKGY